MKRTLTALYVMLYTVALSNDITKFDPKTDSFLNIGLECVFHLSAIIVILFYIFNFRPKSLISFFKIFPISLVVFDIASTYELVSALVSLNEPIGDYILVALFFIPVIVPSWYLTFRFGYLKSINPFKNMPLSVATNDNSLKNYKTKSYRYAVSLSSIFGILLAFTLNTIFGKHSNIHNFTVCVVVMYLIIFYISSKKNGFQFYPNANLLSTPSWIMAGQLLVVFTSGCLLFLIL